MSDEIRLRAGRSGTYYFDAVAWSGGECPGTRFLAGVFIWPVRARNNTANTIHSVVTASCKKNKEE